MLLIWVWSPVAHYSKPRCLGKQLYWGGCVAVVCDEIVENSNQTCILTTKNYWLSVAGILRIHHKSIRILLSITTGVWCFFPIFDRLIPRFFGHVIRKMSNVSSLYERNYLWIKGIQFYFQSQQCLFFCQAKQNFPRILTPSWDQLLSVLSRPTARQHTRGLMSTSYT